MIVESILINGKTAKNCETISVLTDEGLTLGILRDGIPFVYCHIRDCYESTYWKRIYRDNGRRYYEQVNDSIKGLEKFSSPPQPSLRQIMDEIHKLLENFPND